MTPDVNIYETKDGFVLEAEMPGVPKDGLEVTLEGNTLTFVGRKRVEMPEGQAIYQESQHADYRRVFELDPSIDTSKIAARMERGILVLRLPKAEKVKPRKITVSD